MSADRHRALVRLPPDGRGRTRVAVAERPAPRLDPGDVLLAPLVAGVCGTDWQILHGLRDDPSPVLGHEGTARVVEPGTSGLRTGALVTVNPTHPDDPSFLLGHNLPGLWAERTRIPASAVRAGLVLPVPDTARRPEVAALAEPLASVLYGRDIALTAARPASVVIWGDGVVGRLARKVWQREVPAPRVLLVGRGTDATAPDDPRLPGLLAELPSPVCALLATWRTGTREALTEVDRHIRGTLVADVHAGLAAGPVPLSCGEPDVAALRADNCGGLPRQPLVHRFARPGGPLLLHGHRGVSRDHLERAVALLSDAAFTTDDVLTHEVDLAGAAELINSVLAAPRREADGRRVLKVAVRPGGA
ncbi:alcohol dehydrogenase catalytic domain-containing protein [Streptomyces rubiginosohelvolus]|uniref:alcohol dehydrogenase catalytic domain-containing protein n=1 Tax=Streptomyces rubiginosohelvolus TaxID=67362 RepID=UPI0036DDB1B0